MLDRFRAWLNKRARRAEAIRSFNYKTTGWHIPNESVDGLYRSLNTSHVGIGYITSDEYYQGDIDIVSDWYAYIYKSAKTSHRLLCVSKFYKKWGL